MNCVSTLPLNLCLRRSEHSTKGYGVWTIKEIPEKTRFGPYRGVFVDNISQWKNTGFQWKLETKGKEIKTLDGSNESQSNWLRYVNYACNTEEQNLVALQHKSIVYYVACKSIPENTELRVWYSHTLVEGGRNKKKGYSGNKNDGPNRETMEPDTRRIGHIDAVQNRESDIEIIEECQKTTRNSSDPSKYFDVENSLRRATENMPAFLKQVVKPKEKESKLNFTGCMEIYRQTNADGKTVMNNERLHLAEGKERNANKTLTSNKQTRHSEIKFQSTSSWREGKNRKTEILQSEAGSNTESQNPNTNSNQFKPNNDFKTTNLGGDINGGHFGTGKKKVISYKVQTIHEKNQDTNKYKSCQSLISHDKIPEKLSTRECKECGKYFSSSNYLSIHERIHSGDDKPYRCHVCGRRFIRGGHLKRHLMVHSNEKPYKCDICEKKFKTPNYVNMHKNVHTGKKRYRCHECGKKCAQKCNLVRHLLIHSDEMPYKCDACEKKFKSHEDLKVHKDIHTAEKQYRCDELGQTLTQLNQLTTQFLVHISGNQIHKRVDTSKESSEHHKRGKKFVHRGSLDNLFMTQPGGIPFICNICDKKFKTCSQLEVHERIHTGEKPYECQICGKKFTQSGHLNVHLKVHRSRMPYECLTCGNTFVLKLHLTKHLRCHKEFTPENLSCASR